MYSVCKLHKWNISKLKMVSDILYKCGKDMAAQYDLHHWDNSHIKNYIVVGLCALKNDIFLVYDENVPVATFQIRKEDKSLLFQKLATSPAFAGGGIGSYCINIIEMMAKESGLTNVICEVYAESKHAITFYEHRGYKTYGTTQTLKYKEYKMRKDI